MTPASYAISLISVERHNGDKKMDEKQSIENVSEEEITKYGFEDEVMKIKWYPTPMDIFFAINNKEGEPIIIAWDESRFIDANGVNHKLIHDGIGYDERNNAHPPTVILAGGTLEDFVHPADYFQREEGKDKPSNNNRDHWRRAPFLPTQIRGTAEELRQKVESLEGGNFQVSLALQINNIRNDYIYTFKINKVEVTEKQQQQENSPDEGKGSRRGSRRDTF